MKNTNTKTYKITISNWEYGIEDEVYFMTMDELAQSITREFAKEILNEEEFKTFCEKQNEYFEEQRRWAEDFARTTYIPDELRDAI